MVSYRGYSVYCSWSILYTILSAVFEVASFLTLVKQKYIKKQQTERNKKLKEDRLLKERAVKEKQKKLEVRFVVNIFFLIVITMFYVFCKLGSGLYAYYSPGIKGITSVMCSEGKLQVSSLYWLQSK